MSTADEKNITDQYGRHIKYLRVSVTDRCNFRCKYCVPAVENYNHVPHPQIMTYEEMLTVVEVFAELGVHKVRVTGGEPLVRRGIESFLGEISKVKGIDEVTLTTNGALLGKFADSIKQAGIKRINVSLDSLRPDRYKEITGGFNLQNLIEGIRYAQSIGIGPIKTNTVVIKGFNDDEIGDFCDFAAENNITSRFIEFMPVGNYLEWKDKGVLSGKEMLDVISAKYSTKELKKEKYAGPAKNYLLSNGARVGIITPISNHFCSECDKLRITADGKLRPCLLSDTEIDILPVVRTGYKQAIKAEIIRGLFMKEKEHHVLLEKKNNEFSRTMSKIGG
ncbi:MAG: GTP 3',8-cyclase MoaA [Deferribacterales bacterium]